MEMVLKSVSNSHKSFVRELFQDELVKRYVILDDDIGEDVGDLVDIWLDEASRNAGKAWIIFAIEPASFFKPEKTAPCGYIDFKCYTQNSGRVTYALLEGFRGKGFVKTGLKSILQHLKELGIQFVEADIDRDNIASENIVEFLGFTTDKRAAVIDFDRGGKVRHLWKKSLG